MEAFMSTNSVAYKQLSMAHPEKTSYAVEAGKVAFAALAAFGLNKYTNLSTTASVALAAAGTAILDDASGRYVATVREKQLADQLAGIREDVQAKDDLSTRNAVRSALAMPLIEEPKEELEGEAAPAVEQHAPVEEAKLEEPPTEPPGIPEGETAETGYYFFDPRGWIWKSRAPKEEAVVQENGSPKKQETDEV